jgi:hypothetical protein
MFDSTRLNTVQTVYIDTNLVQIPCSFPYADVWEITRFFINHTFSIFGL